MRKMQCKAISGAISLFAGRDLCTKHALGCRFGDLRQLLAAYAKELKHTMVLQRPQ